LLRVRHAKNLAVCQHSHKNANLARLRHVMNVRDRSPTCAGCNPAAVRGDAGGGIAGQVQVSVQFASRGGSSVNVMGITLLYLGFFPVCRVGLCYGGSWGRLSGAVPGVTGAGILGGRAARGGLFPVGNKAVPAAPGFGAAGTRQTAAAGRRGACALLKVFTCLVRCLVAVGEA
jgi:hypothetical protein